MFRLCPFSDSVEILGSFPICSPLFRPLAFHSASYQSHECGNLLFTLSESVPLAKRQVYMRVTLKPVLGHRGVRKIVSVCSYFYLKDSCEGSGLSTRKGSQGSCPFFIIQNSVDRQFIRRIVLSLLWCIPVQRRAEFKRRATHVHRRLNFFTYL